MSDLRTNLERLGERARPEQDAYERLERRRRRKERNRRIGAGVLALVLVVGGSAAAFTAFRGGDEARTVGGGQTSDGFFALWPEQTEAGLVVAQEHVDGGDPDLSWRSDPIDVANRFALERLLWPAATVSAAEGSDLEADDVIFIELEIPPETSCDQIVADATCPTSRLTLTMERLGRDDGVWSIVEVSGDELALPLVAGDVVAAGTSISVPTNLADGEKVSMGVAFLSACDALGIDDNVEAAGGTLSLQVPAVPHGCTGYVYAMTPNTPVGAVAIGSFLLTDAAAIPSISYLVEEIAAIPVRFANDTPAEVTEFTCDSTGTISPARSVVAAQPDGVHIAMTNTADLPVAFSVGDLGGEGAEPGERKETVWQLPPGTTLVSCSVESPEFGGVASSASLTVVDPGGIYVPAELECAGGEGYGQATEYAEGATGIAGDPVQVARDHLSGLEFDDLVERGGYPEAEHPLVRVVRDGVVAGRVTFFDDGSGGWLVDTIEGCGDTQFGWSDEPTGVTGSSTHPASVCLSPDPPVPSEFVEPSVDLRLEGRDLRFDTDCLVAVAGEPLTITFDNADEGIPRNVSVHVLTPCLRDEVISGATPAPACPNDLDAPLFVGDIVTGVDQVVYELGLLEAGEYYFLDDVHPTTASGILIVL